MAVVNMKGHACPYKTLFCQEGYCAECQVHLDATRPVRHLHLDVRHMRTTGQASKEQQLVGAGGARLT